MDNCKQDSHLGPVLDEHKQSTATVGTLFSSREPNSSFGVSERGCKPIANTSAAEVSLLNRGA